MEQMLNSKQIQIQIGPVWQAKEPELKKLKGATRCSKWTAARVTTQSTIKTNSGLSTWAKKKYPNSQTVFYQKLHPSQPVPSICQLCQTPLPTQMIWKSLSHPNCNLNSSLRQSMPQCLDQPSSTVPRTWVKRVQREVTWQSKNLSKSRKRARWVHKEHSCLEFKQRIALNIASLKKLIWSTWMISLRKSTWAKKVDKIGWLEHTHQPLAPKKLLT